MPEPIIPAKCSDEKFRPSIVMGKGFLRDGVMPYTTGIGGRQYEFSLIGYSRKEDAFGLPDPSFCAQSVIRSSFPGIKRVDSDAYLGRAVAGGSPQNTMIPVTKYVIHPISF
jgi:hypothetical protein